MVRRMNAKCLLIAIVLLMARQSRAMEVTLDNGVSVDNQRPASPQTAVVTFSTAATRSFDGYGANLPVPAESEQRGAIDALKSLHMTWVKVDFESPFTGPRGGPAPLGLSPDTLHETIRSAMAAYVEDHPAGAAFLRKLHANGIRVVATTYHAPKNFLTIQAGARADGGDRKFVRQETLGDFVQFYVAWLRVLDEMQLAPDLVELTNEPNGAWAQKFTPQQFATLVVGIQAGLKLNGLKQIIAAPGTAGKQIDTTFLAAIQESGAVASLAAINVHAYYTLAKGAPLAEDPGYARMFDTARRANIPLMVTEFGGKAEQGDKSAPPLPALELKAALDLVRQGASAALVWDLRPFIKSDGWSLLDNSNQPTAMYYGFMALSPQIPREASVLAIQNCNIKPTMTSPGYAAFTKDGQLVAGLTNPSDAPVDVALDIAHVSDLRLTHLWSFAADRVIDRAVDLPARGALAIKLPAGAGVILNMTASAR